MPGPRSPAIRNGHTSRESALGHPATGSTTHNRHEHAGEQRLACIKSARRNAGAHAHGHRPEQHRRRESEQDGIHPSAAAAVNLRGAGRAAAGSATRMPASITAHPAQPAQPSISSASSTPSERRERRFEREHERRPCRRGSSLHPRRDEVAERTGEDAGHEEGAPDRRAARHLEVAERSAITVKPRNDVAICRNVSARGS